MHIEDISNNLRICSEAEGLIALIAGQPIEPCVN